VEAGVAGGRPRRWPLNPAAVGGAGRPRINLLGTFQLLDATGLDRTPPSALLQALLAILVLSPDGRRSRSKLRDLLWSEMDAEHAAFNLRQTLRRLKVFLSSCGLDIVEIDGLTVQLKLATVTVDIFQFVDDPAGALVLRRNFGSDLPEILEGLDLRSGVREDFEDWLRQERQLWWDRLEAIRDAEEIEPLPAGGVLPGRETTPLVALEAVKAPGFGVGLLPPIIEAGSPEIQFLADGFIESVATALRDVALAEIYDYRDSGCLFAPADEGSGPPLLLRVRAHQEGSARVLALIAHRCGQRRLLWNWKVVVAEDDAAGLSLMRFVNEAVDRVCETLVSLGADGESGITPYHALNMMFRLDSVSLGTARQMLERAYDETGDAVHLSLLAYLNSFRVGEHWLTYDESVRSETQGLVDAILETKPFNSLTLAMTGHACGYILHDNGLAIDLLERSTRLDASLAICWDHLALNYLYAGRLPDAERASMTAIQLGSFSPFRFTYDATMCMILTLKGDYEQAVNFGKRSLARRPSFGAPLRYTAISYAHLGESAAARRIVDHIRSMSSDFSVDWVHANRLAVIDPEAKSRLAIGLRKAGA
jgi:hypothetical protein